MSTRTDLRARNVERNRAEAAEIALELFERDGYDAVGVDDIARAAGISRRTFFRYFDSKEGVVLPFEDERIEVLRHALEDSAPGEPPLSTVRRAVVAMASQFEPHERDTARRRMRIVEDNPSVHARSLELLSQWEDVVRAAIADSLGEDPATSMTARVTASAAIAAFRSAAGVWVANGGTEDLAQLLDEAFEVLAAGLAFRPVS